MEGDIEAQTEQVLKNLLAVLKEAKMGPENVVKTTVFLADLADFPRMNEVYARYLGKEPPARSTIQAAALPRGVEGRDRRHRGVLSGLDGPGPAATLAGSAARPWRACGAASAW